MTESSCAEHRRRLATSRWSTLPPEARAEVERHLQGCEECRAFAKAERELDAALGRLPRQAAPEALKARLAATLRAEAAPPSVSSRWAKWRDGRKLRLVSATAAVVLAGALSVVFALRPSATERLVDEAVNDHLRVLYATHPIEIESGGIHQVKPWFEGRLDFAPVLDFAGDEEFPLQGGSIGYLLDRKAAVFVFKRRLHVVTLFVFRAEGLPWPYLGNRTLDGVSARLEQSRGFNALLFRQRDLGYALVSDADANSLERLGHKIMAGH